MVKLTFIGLTDGHGDQLSFGNIQAVFTVTDEDVDLRPSKCRTGGIVKAAAAGLDLLSHGDGM